MLGSSVRQLSATASVSVSPHTSFEGGGGLVRAADFCEYQNLHPS